MIAATGAITAQCIFEPRTDDRAIIGLRSAPEDTEKYPSRSAYKQRGPMSYIEQSLMAGESVSFRTRLHPIVFTAPAFCALIAAILFAGPDTGAGGGFFLFVAILLGTLRYLDFATSEFAVTNRRVIIKVGIIRRRTLELQLSKVEAIAVDQGILGRMLGYGNIVVTGTGGTKEPFRRISAPLDFRRAVQATSA